MRMIAVLLAIGMLAGLAVPAAFAQKSTQQQTVVDRWKQLNGRLEKAFFNVRTAAELLRKTQADTQIDLTQAILSLAQAEQKLNQAIAMVREVKPKTVKAGAPPREQIEQLERIVGEALKLVRAAAQHTNAGLKSRPADLRKIGLFVKKADQNADAAMKMLRQMVASR